MNKQQFKNIYASLRTMRTLQYSGKLPKGVNWVDFSKSINSTDIIVCIISVVIWGPERTNTESRLAGYERRSCFKFRRLTNK